ncbi:MAG: TetR/AcrR family transcriptional regulator [Thermomicrobiales bacterium]|nr:TetR/AcrR family transcriptional regulator [Thermomicrobiales bacterium]MCO5222379.1 TetR/AcrR family transcriptional regulator [Thermomicrobiales bacterium]
MRTEILAAAQHIIRTQGMDALSLRAIAKAVGVTAPALYEYFDSKDAILRGLFVQGAELMLSLVDEQVASRPPGIETLREILHGYRQFARDEPDYFRLLFGTVDPALALTEVDYQPMQAIFERFAGLIAASIELGELQPLPVMTLSCALWALIHGAAMLETDSFIARKKHDGEETGPSFDAAVHLTLLNFATLKGAEMIGPLDDDCM